MIDFDVCLQNNYAPTQVELTAEARRFQNRMWLMLAAGLLLLGAASWLMRPDLSELMPSTPLMSVLWCVGTLICFFSGLGFVLVGVTTQYDLAKDFGAPLASKHCEKLLEYCQATPEGLAYRAAVLQQARAFTAGEFRALRAWADSARARQACDRLYAVSGAADLPRHPVRDAI